MVAKRSGMLTVSTLLARSFLEVEGLDFLKAVLDQQMPLSVWQPGEVRNVGYEDKRR